LATDRQTDEQMDSIDALSRSRCRERRLNKVENSKHYYSTWSADVFSRWLFFS